MDEVFQRHLVDLPAYNSVGTARKCTTCGEPIFFKKNSNGKYIPFNISDNRCHFETCSHMHNLVYVADHESVQMSRFKNPSATNNVKDLGVYI